MFASPLSRRRRGKQPRPAPLTRAFPSLGLGCSKSKVAGEGRMVRGRVEIRRIANDVSRRATFGKRSAGLLKKAQELAVLCDADLGVLVFDGAFRQFDYCSPHTRSGPGLFPVVLDLPPGNSQMEFVLIPASSPAVPEGIV